jgi:glycosyltransferase involved in cell wall biosynthesis
MKFGIITHAVHKLKDGRFYGYEPYVREMNLWAKYVDEIIIIAPISDEEISPIEIAYQHPKIKIVPIPKFDITSVRNLIRSLFVIPKICLQIYKVMKSVDHIHLRCPGNIGVLGCFVQVFFPKKLKTVKYAGNWDPKSLQPISYKIQKWILSNTFLTRNCKVLVYGKWKNQSKNIIPFFTASYNNSEQVSIEIKKLSQKIQLIFVGAFSEGKQPLMSVKAAEQLILQGYDVELNMFGNGAQFEQVQKYTADKFLEKKIILHGNQPKDTVTSFFKKSHFLLFISKSEGWPKVVAEAMFWGCLPISSSVSCVPYMLHYGERGTLVSADINEKNIFNIIKTYIQDEKSYQEKVLQAQNWSHKYTLEKFELEIKKLLD